MSDIIDKLESATGRDPGIDQLIGNSLWQDQTDQNPRNAFDCYQDYTAAIDAALSLVPDGWEWLLRAPSKDGPRDEGRYFARIESPDFEAVTYGKGETWLTDVLGGFEAIAWAATPALALCAAALKARARDSRLKPLVETGTGSIGEADESGGAEGNRPKAIEP